MRKLWITDQPYPATEQVVSAAQQAGAEEVLHGIPISLQGQIPEGTTGYFELPDPVLPEDPPAPEVIAAEAILEEVQTRLAPTDVNSIVEVKAAVIDGMTAAVDRLRGS